MDRSSLKKVNKISLQLLESQKKDPRFRVGLQNYAWSLSKMFN